MNTVAFELVPPLLEAGTEKAVEEGRIVDVKRYPAERINPPEGMKSEAWIKSGLKK